MIISATGLHGSGKSHLLKYISERLDVPYFHKRHTLQSLSPEKDQISWYRNEYKKFGVYQVTKKVLQLLPKYNDLIVFDAVHSLAELRALKEYDSQVILIGVFCPNNIRLSRNLNEDSQLDVKRISYWHEPDIYTKSACLLSESEWSFNGCMNSSIMEVNVSHFIEHIKKITLNRLGEL